MKKVRFRTVLILLLHTVCYLSLSGLTDHDLVDGEVDGGQGHVVLHQLLGDLLLPPPGVVHNEFNCPLNSVLSLFTGGMDPSVGMD